MKLSETVRLLNSKRTMVYILGFVLYAQSGYAQAPFSLPTPVTDLTGLLDLFTDEILDAAEAFEQRTGMEAKVLAAYRFAPDSPFGIENEWSPFTTDELLFAINTNENTEDGNWSWEENVKIFASQNIATDFPVSLRDQTISNVMIPILKGLPDNENKVYEAPEKYAQAIMQALQYMADVLEGPYFMISERKYYSGSIAYLGQADDEVEELAAFLGDGTPFPGSSVWSGVTSESGHIATFSVNAPSAASSGDPVSISYDNSGTLEELAIHIVVVKVTFRKHPDQVYGFDDNVSFIKSDGKFFCYPSFKTSPPKDGIPWKSIETRKTDLVIAKVNPTGVEDKIFFFCDSEEFSIEVNNKNSDELDISIVAGGDETSGLVSAVLEEDTGFSSGFLKVVSYSPLSKNIVVIEGYNNEINNSSHSLLPSPESIFDYLRLKYSEGVASIYANYEISENLNFDINIHDEIEVPGTQLYSEELNKVFENCTVCEDYIDPIPENSPKFLFLLDLSTYKMVDHDDDALTPDVKVPHDIQGRFIFQESGSPGPMYGFVFTYNLGSLNVETVIAHELGHGLFFLKHPFMEFDSLVYPYPDCEAGISGGLDGANIMEYSEDIDKYFRKYQWDKIHGI